MKERDWGSMEDQRRGEEQIFSWNACSARP